MIYNPLNKKKYCLTSCAKDKIETYILKPIALIILVGLFLLNIYFLSEENLLLTGMSISAIALILFVFTKIILEVFDALNTKIDTWISTPYQKHKKCMLFQECD